MKSYPFIEPPNKPGDLGQLGHYRVINELGKGGMGYVFRAEDIKLRRSVALKVMNQKIAATPHSRRRFIREARAMAAVHHDNVATIFEVGESNGTPFMAMEMLQGSTLEDLNDRKRRFGYEEIIELARQMAKGLAAAHAKGIVHRDIKPANIWIQQDSNRVKILDFGLALASSPIDHMAGRGAVVGTPGYLSPEQAMSEPLDDRSDLYSLGVVLYELCTGRLPSDAKSVPAQLISILVHRPKPIEDFNPEIPAPLRDLIHRLLRKEPRSRPRSAQGLLEELDRVESECHVKSEVAQAINKLQLGLQEVVSKQSGSSIFDVEAIPEAHPDPLAIPAAQPATTVPVTKAAVRPAPANKHGATTAPTWLAYWPLAVVVAIALIALPVLTFLFARMGRSNGPTPSIERSIASASPQGSEATANPSMDRVSPDDGTSLASQPANGTASRDTLDTNLPSDPQSQPTDASSSNRPGQLRPDATSRKVGNVYEASDANRGGATTSMRPSPSLPSPSSQLASAALSTSPEATNPVPTKPGPEMKWTAISTADGRGADAMVQNGSKQKYGLKLSLGVRMRGNVENNHSYLRFDLAGIEETRQWADAAELVLTVVGQERPVGASVRVFAVDVGLWPEEHLEWSKSYSPRGLDSLPLIGAITVGPDADPKDVGLNVIRIASPQLAEAIAKSTRDTLTLVLAGSGADDSMLRFVSREQSASAAPRLEVHAPKNPPAKLQRRSGRPRGIPRSGR